MSERGLLEDLIVFLRRSATPYHAVAESRHRLVAAGFRALDEGSPWDLSPGDRFLTTRHDGSLVAGIVANARTDSSAFRVIGAHTDSPNLRVKPLPESSESGTQQIALEPYGGVLLHTWLDRDLSVAGRVTLLREGRVETVLVNIERPILRVPSLAIHLNRELKDEGLRLNPQLHLSALIGCGTQSPFRSILAESIETAGGARESEILSFDLMAYDASPPALVGADGEFLSAGRIDNLVSCHAAVTALLETRSVASDQTRLIVLYDHEEVGSRSASGAAGPFLNSVIDRIAETAGLETDQKAAALARSSLLSVDMAHAVHPNWPERHDRLHRPVLGAGPILKVNANQSYATDAVTAGAFAALCRECGVGLQHFVSRSDYVCGSTIGPITSALTGIRTADVGSPMLAMHSCRELAASADVEPMIRVLAKFLLA